MQIYSGKTGGDAVLNLFVLNAESDKVPVYVSAATSDGLRATANWQT